MDLAHYSRRSGVSVCNLNLLFTRLSYGCDPRCLIWFSPQTFCSFLPFYIPLFHFLFLLFLVSHLDLKLESNSFLMNLFHYGLYQAYSINVAYFLLFIGCSPACLLACSLFPSFLSFSHSLLSGKNEDYLRFLTNAGETRFPIFAWGNFRKMSHFWPRTLSFLCKGPLQIRCSITTN